MYSIWAYCPSEIEWYEKMKRLLKKHNCYHEWSEVIISYLYSVFCQITCNEPIPDMDVIFDYCEMDIDDWLEYEDINVSIEMLSTYMKENDLTEINLESFRDVLRERLYERVHELKHYFWTVLDKEFRDPFDKILFFYVREEHFKRARNTDKSSTALDIFTEETDIKDNEYSVAKEDGTKVKTILYSFLNHYDATREESTLRVYNWIEKNTNLRR